ncbi:MAG TPA: hypothetical protein VGL56_06950 [Fimbriimonadaceae bacterium]
MILLTKVLLALAISAPGGPTKLQQFQKAAAELPAALRAAKAEGVVLVPSDLDRTIPAGKNGASAFLKVFANLKKVDIADVQLTPPADPTKDLVKAKAYVRARANLIAQIKTAAAFPCCIFGPHGKYPDPHFMEFAPMKLVVKLLCRDARYRALLGDQSGAAADILAASQVMRHSAEDPSVIGNLVAVAIGTIVCRSCEAMVNESKDSVHLALRLAGALNDLPLSFSQSDALRTEMAYRYSMALPEKITVKDLADNFEGVATAAKGIQNSLARDAFRARLLQYYTAQQRVLKAPGLTMRQRYEKLESIETAQANGDYTYALNRADFSEARAYQADIKYSAFRETTLVGLNLVAHEVTFPPTLPSGVPQDPFSDRAFHYKLLDKGFIVYSVGANHKDDGGSSKIPADDVAFRYHLPAAN